MSNNNAFAVLAGDTNANGEVMPKEKHKHKKHKKKSKSTDDGNIVTDEKTLTDVSVVGDKKTRKKEKEKAAKLRKRDEINASRAALFLRLNGGGNGDDDDVTKSLTAEEKDALTKMKELVEADTVVCDAVAKGFHQHDDATLLRFLRARNYHVDHAWSMYTKCTQWRIKTEPHNICMAQIQHLYDLGVYFPYGYDRIGNPVVTARVCKWQKKFSTDGTLASLYHLEHAFRYRCKEKNELITLVFDLRNFSFLQSDTAWSYRFAMVLRDFYPERIALILCIDAPWVFNAFWNIIKGWVDPVTKSKIVWLGKDYENHITSYISLDSLPDYLGGSIKSQATWEHFVEERLEAEGTTNNKTSVNCIESSNEPTFDDAALESAMAENVPGADFLDAIEAEDFVNEKRSCVESIL